jgi:hypothetical protein
MDSKPISSLTASRNRLRLLDESNQAVGTRAGRLREETARRPPFRNRNGLFVDSIPNVIYSPNENSKTHIIQERRAAKAPSLAGDGVLQGRRAFLSHLHSSCQGHWICRATEKVPGCKNGPRHSSQLIPLIPRAVVPSWLNRKKARH